MVILLKGKKYYKKYKSLFNVILGNVNLFTKINSKNWIKLINNINRPSILCQYGIIFLASIGTSRTRDKRNRWNQKTLEIWEKGKLVKALNMPLRVIEHIVEQGKVVESGRGKKAKLLF